VSSTLQELKADELRRAVGMRRSWERMKNLEGKLREGMTANKIDAATQDTIVQNISSFALYGLPESHAASFALLAYASAFFKVKYSHSFHLRHSEQSADGLLLARSSGKRCTQHHGLRVKPIDVQVSDWPCTVRERHSRAFFGLFSEL
jgi:error-prone DNA polymerase